MIVEFIGCDGAGKTTLSRMLAEPGLLDSRAVRMPDLLLDRAGLRWITHPTAANVVQEVCGLPFLLRSYRRRRDYLAFARRMHARYAPTTFDRLNGMRGIARRVGMYELARSRAADRIVLSDEGTVLSAYLFALTDVELEHADLERFVGLVPRPDRIVYVKAPIASLVNRATTRRDRRHQHAGKTAEEVERTIRRTIHVFDLVAQAPPLRDRVLVIENDDDGVESLRRLSAGLTSELRSWASMGAVQGHPAARAGSDALAVEPRH